MYTSLTSAGGVEDASDMHTHDDRYYTETEMDATISGLQSQITTYSDHGNLSGLGDDDHTQYILVDGSRGFTSTVSGVDPTQDYHLATKFYVDDEIATLSGSIILDHGSLLGLLDDDHPQYILTDGSRGFTSTVSGVDPTQDYHLATKAYVDAGGMDRHGRYAIANDTCTFTVSFADIGTTNYTINATLENTSDSPPSIYAFIVSARTSSSFDITLMGDTDSANYVLNWTVIED
jgi:ribosome-binding factor A